MKSIIVNCMEGLSASSREEEDTVSNIVKHQITEFLKTNSDAAIMFNEVSSKGDQYVDDSLKFIFNNTHYGKENTGLLLTGKSMGGVKTWWMLKSHWKKLKEFNAIFLLTIDPHGVIAGDGKAGTYGKNHELSFDKRWKGLPNLQAINLYQHYDWPHGAKMGKIDKVKNAKNIKFKKGSDHFNIIDVDSDKSKPTKEAIITGLSFLSNKI